MRVLFQTLLCVLRSFVFIPVVVLIAAGTLLVCIMNVFRTLAAVRTARQWITTWWLWTTGELSTLELVR
jgi:hypothetical protein